MAIDLMHIKNLKDFRTKLKRHPEKIYKKRTLNKITHIAVHHSLTKTGSAEAFANYHVTTHKWPGIGYHFVIEKDGSIKWCNDLESKTYHVGNSNGFSLGICLTGDFRTQDATREQWNSLFRLTKYLVKELNISAENVWGHNQFKGYDWKECPCIDMDYVRENLVKGGLQAIPTERERAKIPPGSYIMKRGEGPFSLLKKFGFLDYGELKRLNTLEDPKKVKPGTEVLLKNEAAVLSSELKTVITVMQNHGHNVFKSQTENYNINIVGIRTSNNIPNKFDDELMVFWKFENRWTLKKFKITTDPGLTYLNQPLNDYGTAILKEGQYKGAYIIGKHRGRYKALEQKGGPVTVIRDFNQDDRLDYHTGREQTGFFGINIHRSNAARESTIVNKWSAGCQVFANPVEFNEFMSLCERARLNWGNSFT